MECFGERHNHATNEAKRQRAAGSFAVPTQRRSSTADLVGMSGRKHTTASTRCLFNFGQSLQWWITGA